mgnify:CR=1 FL=1
MAEVEMCQMDTIMLVELLELVVEALEVELVILELLQLIILEVAVELVVQTQEKMV